MDFYMKSLGLCLAPWRKITALEVTEVALIFTNLHTFLCFIILLCRSLTTKRGESHCAAFSLHPLTLAQQKYAGSLPVHPKNGFSYPYTKRIMSGCTAEVL